MPDCIIRIDGAKKYAGLTVTVDRTSPEAGSYLLYFNPKARKPHLSTITDRSAARVFTTHEDAKVIASLLPSYATTILPKEDTAQ